MSGPSSDKAIPTWYCLSEVSPPICPHPAQCKKVSQVYKMSHVACLRRKLLKEVVLLAESEGSEVTEDIATPYSETLLQPEQVCFQ